MDVTPPQHDQMASGDDELAKVLSGATGEAKANATPAKSEAESAGLQFEETPLSGAPASAPAPSAPDPLAPALPDLSAPSALPTSNASLPTPQANTPDLSAPTLTAPAAPSFAPSTTPSIGASVSPAAGGLEQLKKTALEELRPLVGKLDLPAEEKFDTLLLVIRSTDDQSLLSDAHEAAKGITDETKRAQALLDVIKEIDYFSNQPR